MADYPLPPWLQPVNPVPFYSQGMSTGADIAAQQNRMELSVQEMTLRREAEQRTREAQAIGLIQTAQEIGMRQEAAQAKAQEQSLKWQAQQKYSKLIEGGKEPMQAWIESFGASNPETAGSVLASLERQKAINLQRAASRPQYTNTTENIGGKDIPIQLDQFGKKLYPPSGMLKDPNEEEEKVRRGHEYAAWLTDYRRASQAESVAKSNLDKFTGKRLTQAMIQSGDTTVKSQLDSLNKAVEEATKSKQMMIAEGRKRGMLTQDAKPEGESSNSPIPTVTSQQQFDELSPGALFIENGVTYRKPM